MKKINIPSLFLFLLIAVSFVMFSCKEENLRMIAQEDNAQAPLCDDGILNGDETEIDCGGSCESCMVVPCAPTANSITFSGQGSALSDNYTEVECEANALNNTYELYGTSSTRDITIKLAGTAPVKSGVYDIVQYISGTPNTATINFSYNNNMFNAATGKVYVKVSNSVVTATFCNMIFESFNVSGSYTGSGQLTCN